MADIMPTWVLDVPLCWDRCPAFDGKRCEILGHRPERICEPAVKALSQKTRRLKRRMKAMDAERLKGEANG